MTTEHDRDALLATWKSAATEEERARVEWRLWDSATRQERARGRREWLTQLLGGESARAIETRFAIAMRPPEVQTILWARIDGPEQMTLHSAAQILKRARIRQLAQNLLLHEAVERELQEYDTWPLCQVDGRTFRKAPARGRRGIGAGKGRHVTLRAALWQLIEEELGGASVHERTELLGQLQVEVDTMMDLLRARIRVAARQVGTAGAPVAPGAALQERKALLAACEQLAVDAPRKGQHLDAATFKIARKNFRRLAHEYHPDRGGDRARYEPVVEAMRVLTLDYEAGVKPAASPDDTSATTTEGTTESWRPS